MHPVYRSKVRVRLGVSTAALVFVFCRRRVTGGAALGLGVSLLGRASARVTF